MARVTGRVLAKGDPTGAEGVWVFAMPLERGFSLAFPAAVRTGASGRFEMPGIVPGAVTIFAMGGGWTSTGLADVDPEGFNPLAQTLAPGESKEIELEVEPAGRLEGRVVTQAGQGVPGAVLALRSSFFAFRITAQTALFGGGVGSPPFVSDELSVASGATERLDVVLEAARWLVLAVKSSDGTPLPGATVFAGVAQGGTDEHQRVSGEWHTDATGTARVGPLPPGAIAVQAKAGEHLAIKDWQPVAGGAATGDLADTVVLEKGLAVGGRVTVPDGASPARVSITVKSRRPGGGRWVWEHTAPDADGSWRLGGLPDGTYEVEADLVWQDERYEAKATVAAGDAGVDLALVAAGSRDGSGLVVRILGPDGEPVPGGNVSLITRSKNSSGTHSQSFSNGKATFEVDPDEDEVWVQAWARPGSGFGDALLGPIPERSGEVVLRLPRARSIEGRVVTREGEGVGGVRVESFLPSPLGNRHGGRGEHFALTDEDGRFELRDLGEGPYEVHVKAPPQYGPVPPLSVSSGAKGVRFELAEAAAADVTVLDYEGRAVSGARVTAGIDDETAKRAGIERHSRGFTTDGEGVAHVRGLAAGVPYNVSVTPPDGRDDVRATAIRAWTPEALTVRLERAYVIQGVVHDLTGKPVAEAQVEYGAEDDPGHWLGTQTAEDGTFQLAGLERGRYRVRAQVGAGSMPMPRAPGFEEEGWVVVEAGTRDLVLKVDPGATLRIRIQPWTGNEWGQGIAMREQRPGGGSHSQGQVDGEGVAVFRGCSPDKRYDVFVGDLPDGQYVLARDLRATGKEIVLAPQTGGTIRGRLLVPSGAEVGYQTAFVQILGMSHSGTVHEDGTFEIEGVPPGTWEVWGNARRGDDWLLGRVQAAPGGTVEIELAPR